MKLTTAEKSLLDGSAGKAKQKAMELLVRYGEALGAERFVDATNVAGVPGQSSVFLQRYYGTEAPPPDDSTATAMDGGSAANAGAASRPTATDGGSAANAGAASRSTAVTLYDKIFSLFDLDSDELVDVPQVVTHACHLQGGYDPDNWQLLGASPEAARISRDSEAGAVHKGIKILKTCTPYLVGNVPKQGEHCAWMESSAVVYCNSVLGARTNTEGRESTSAAMLTGKIPDFGLHRDEHRRGTHLIEVEVPIESLMDWGMLGYFVGDAVQERIPVLTGRYGRPDLIRHKHFGAAAASSGGVEMYHIVGVTPEAPTERAAFGPNSPAETFHYDAAARRRTYENLNANARDPNVDYVMLGCPHAALEQIQEACRLLAGRKISDNCRLWIFTSRIVKQQADQAGLTKIIRDAGGHVLTDTCSAIGQALPPGTKVAALDSAKQVHYLPAIMGIEAWFGDTADCIDAAITGRWNGELR